MDLLLSVFAHHLGLTPDAARPVLDGLLASLRADVQANGTVSFPEVGVFTRGRDGVQFEPDAELVDAVNGPYLGLPPITSRRPPMPTGEHPSPPPESAPPEPAPEPLPPAHEPPAFDPPAEETPPVFSVPLLPTEPSEEPAEASLETPSDEPADSQADPFADEPPAPRVTPALEPEPLRDLSSEAPASEPEAPSTASDEGLDPDLDALIAGMRASAEALAPPPFSPPDPPADADPTPAVDFFGARIEPEHPGPPRRTEPLPQPAGPPPSSLPGERPAPVPTRPPVAPAEATPHPRFPPEPEPERRRVSPWSVLLPLLFLGLLAAAYLLWPRFQADGPGEAGLPPPQETTPQPLLVDPDTAAVALADTTAATETAGADSVAAGEPPAAPEPEPAAIDPLRGPQPIDVAEGGWGWVFGSGSRDGAERDAARYRQLGFRAVAVPGSSNGRPVYRVILGQFDTREAARAAAGRLPAEQPAGIWVTQFGS